VALEAFIDAIRDSGYRTPAHALAELVDNSLEAGANHVGITIEDGLPSGSGQMITVVDDGCGMPPSALQMALQFGGSTRFNSRAGTGRYGMGLPCSALSQARRVDLYSWQSRATTWWTYLEKRMVGFSALSNRTAEEVPDELALAQSDRTGRKWREPPFRPVGERLPNSSTAAQSFSKEIFPSR
jgi:hypothetical protein